MKENIENSKTKLIQLIDIKKIYTLGDVEFSALAGITFDINKGEMVSIIGPSGSGKSTTMHILGALDVPSSGKYLLNNIDVSTMSDNQLAAVRNREIGFVFQSFNLLARTDVLDNVILPLTYANVSRAESEERAIEALKAVNLLDKMKNKPNQLSGGQMQRVAIARALVTNPSLILADEPTGNLDSKTGREVMEIFQRLNSEGKTIIVITHEHDIADYAKRKISLRDGLVVSDERK